MKSHLVNLLLEEYKQYSLFESLREKGIDLEKVGVNNWAIIVDLIGFPKDNSKDYDFNFSEEEGPRKGKKAPDAHMFLRDWLYDNYYDTIESLRKKQEIIVTDDGLKIKESYDEQECKKRLSEHIDWLYNEYEKL